MRAALYDADDQKHEIRGSEPQNQCPRWLRGKDAALF